MRIGLFINPRKPLTRRFVPGFVRWLIARRHEPFVAAPGVQGLDLVAKSLRAPVLVRTVDLVIALGGDGTMLRAARTVGRRQVPIMGVNLGGLGFLTEFSTGEARAGVTAFSLGRHAEERRMVLCCRCGPRTGYVLNDCALNMGPSGRVLEVVASTARSFVNRFVGDGVVVATPTGSTAYSLAAGGPVVVPTMEAILLTPLCPHALAARPLILPPDTRLELRLGGSSESAVLSLDGQVRWQIRAAMPVFVTRADYSVRLVTPKGKTYYRILRDKMKWSGSQARPATRRA